MSISSAPTLASNESPLVAQRLSDRLAARLAAQIDTGALKPGDRLPTGQQLAAAHGVSRTVVREAMHQLQSRGLLWSRQGSGVFVAAPVSHRPLDYDPTVLDSISAVVQVIEVRRVLESEMAALAAERATLKQIAGLKLALAAIDAAVVEGGDGVDEDLAFHRAIGEATGNPQFSRFYGFLAPYVREAMRVTKGNEARRRDFMEQVRIEHRAIVEAIAARDPRAARRCVTAHLSHADRRLEIAGVIDKRGRRK